MNSVFFMFVGGILGGMIGPIGALIGAFFGLLAGLSDDRSDGKPAASLFRGENSGMAFIDSNPFPESDPSADMSQSFFDHQLCSDSSDSLFSDSFSETSVAEINPATGLPMAGGIDTEGNVYGASSDDAFQSPFDDPFDDPFR
jgi:hypothetical protein